MNMRNIVLCILYLFLVPMGGFAQSEVVVLYPDTENKDLDEAVYQKIFLAGTIDMGKSVDWQKATCDGEVYLLGYLQYIFSKERSICTCFFENTYMFLGRARHVAKSWVQPINRSLYGMR